MLKQKWECEKCKKTGEVDYKKGDDVIAVVHLIEDSHKNTSPQCTQPISKIKAPK